MDTFNKLNSFLVKVLDGVATFFLFVMCIGVFLQMTLRYLFNSSIMQMDDIVKIAFSWLIFAGVAALFRNDEHIAVTALVDAVPKKVGNFIYMSQRVLTFIFLIGLLIYGIQFAMTGFTSMCSYLMIPLFWVYVSVPIAAGCSILFYLEFFTDKILNHKRGTTEPATK